VSTTRKILSLATGVAVIPFLEDALISMLGKEPA
jgi:hypothetical protein